MTRPLDDLPRVLDRMGTAMTRAGPDAVAKAALVYKRAILDAAARAAGGDLVLGKVGRRGGRLNVRYDVRGTVNPTALVRATGPWQLVERNLGAHVIPRARRRGRRLRFADGGIRRSVVHPGMHHPPRPFERGTAAGARPAAAAMWASLNRTVVRAFTS